MALEEYIKIAIKRLENCTANSEEKTLDLANESIGKLKNGGFQFFYNYDFDGVSHDEVIEAHSVVNPKIKLINEGFKSYLSEGFYKKSPEDRYKELSDILDEDGKNPAHIWEDRLFEAIENDFDNLNSWIKKNKDSFQGYPEI